jgi:hypothetical protein
MTSKIEKPVEITRTEDINKPNLDSMGTFKVDSHWSGPEPNQVLKKYYHIDFILTIHTFPDRVQAGYPCGILVKK